MIFPSCGWLTTLSLPTRLDWVKLAMEIPDKVFPWYDSDWLTKFVRAKAIVRAVKPGELAGFVDAFRPLHTRLDFQVRLLENPFDECTLGEIKQVIASLRPTDLEMHEIRMFGRFVVHNHPVLLQLQELTIPLVSEAVAEPVETAYNFLSLYTHKGVCPVHLDAPEAKWTLDVCIDQSAPWPIYLSRVHSWLEVEGVDWQDQKWHDKVKQSPSLHFTPYTLQPGQAVIFSGSSQWHYREAIPDAGHTQFCTLLFFHFAPKGTTELVRPENWARLFDIPELIQVA
jgi:hypothetical protein